MAAAVSLRDKETAFEQRSALLRAAAVHGAAFAAYVLRDESNGQQIELADMHVEWHDLIDQESRVLLWSAIEHGKALSVETPIPTPTGWTTMGALREGDSVFDARGAPCTVTFATPVQFGRRCYRVRFDDGDEIVADAEHRWLAATIGERLVEVSKAHMGSGHPCECGCGLRAKEGKRFIHNHHARVARDAGGWRVVTTHEMLASGLLRKSGAHRADGTVYDQYRWRIPLAKPVAFGHRDGLPIDPYLLGAWLGDGDTDNPVITMHADDREIGERCLKAHGGRGHWTRDVRGSGNVWRLRLGDRDAKGPRDGRKLRTRLREANLLGNKHIPASYMIAGIDQRRALLAGLLDTDGSVEPRRGRVEFANTNLRLARDVLELVRSLGFKATIHAKAVTLNGRPMADCYRVFFTAREPVFYLARKLAIQKLGEPFGRARYRSVVAIEEIDSCPVRCISVDSTDHTYLAGRGYTVTHNTSQVSVARTIFELGRDTAKRIVILSKTQGQAVKIIRAIATYIERSSELREVFPNLYPSIPWTSTALMVQREVFSKDFSVQACGVNGAIVGARIDFLIVDDILDWTNTRTPAKRAELVRWFRSEFVGRLTEESKVVVVGNAYHPEDFLHMLAREGYVARTYPVELPNGQPRFPRKWSPRRIAAKRIELGPVEAARQLDCVARKDADVRCKEEWIRQCLKRGVDVPLLRSLSEDAFADGSRSYTGVDIGVGKKKTNGETVLFSGIVYPNGDRRVLAVEAGRWGGLEIVERVVDHHLRYKSIVLVEDNGAQKHILEFAHQAASRRGMEAVTAALNVLPFHTGANKTHPTLGVEAIFAEFAAAKWIIPCTEAQAGRYVTNEQINLWLSECENYDPTRHTGDRLMGSYFFREGGRMNTPVTPGAEVQILGDGDRPEELSEERAEALDGWEAAMSKRH